MVLDVKLNVVTFIPDSICYIVGCLVFLFQLFLRLFFRDSTAERKSRKPTTKLHLMNLTNSLFVSNLNVEFMGTRVTLNSGEYRCKSPGTAI